MTPTEFKQLRAASGMNQEAVALACGFDKFGKQRISQYENGHKGITPAMATLFKMIFSGSKSGS